MDLAFTLLALLLIYIGIVVFAGALGAINAWWRG
jgi:hypothetical protein